MNARAIAILFWVLATPPLAYLLVNAIGATIEHFTVPLDLPYCPPDPSECG